jgi:hypothetical protein
MMKLLGFAITGLMAALMACGGGGTDVKVGQLVSGTITSSNENDGEWKSQTYVIDVRGGVAYEFELTSMDDDTVGIWNADAQGYIVETNLIVTTRTAIFIFEEDGSQNLYLQSPKSDVPSPFTFKVTIRRAT